MSDSKSFGQFKFCTRQTLKVDGLFFPQSGPTQIPRWFHATFKVCVGFVLATCPLCENKLQEVTFGVNESSRYLSEERKLLMSSKVHIKYRFR
jgi:hypothetical protein